MQNIYSCHNTEITTVEGVGNVKKGLHKIQKQLIRNHGIQCGYCSPGMVMNMYSLLESKDHKVSKEEVENSFGGNYCRCTGYRPIMDAFKTLAMDGECCKDIEDIDKVKICSKSNEPCQGKCGNVKGNLKLKFQDEKIWNRVLEIGDIFDIFEKLGKDDGYMLVAGNIGHAAVKEYKNIKTYIDISAVKALKSFSISENQLELGANSTITEAMDIFSKISEENPSFKYLSKIYDHFDLIANIAIRNVATIAGNLAIKQFHDFPSDIFVILQAVDAKLEIASSKSHNSIVTMTEFLEMDMNKKLITKVIFPSYDQDITSFSSFKIMPRSQNTPAYVNAAFLLQIEDQKVIKANICYGGISSSFKRAESVEKFLIGKDIQDNEVVAEALNLLSDEVKPLSSLLAGSSDFRKNLAVSLFYKFILSIVPEDIIAEKFKSGGKILKPELSSSSRNYRKFDESSPIGNALPKVEGDILSTGEAKFANDLPRMVGELYAAFVTAKKVHGVIKGIDASEALVSILGVKFILMNKSVFHGIFLLICRKSQVLLHSTQLRIFRV